MVDVKKFINAFVKNKITFFAGVPDSVLKSFIHCLNSNKKKNLTHRVATNEGSAISLGIGYNLAKKKIPLIYFQNSGIGHASNPLYSMADKRIYSVPMILLIGRRGYPRNDDEPQHFRIGEITKNFLKVLNIPSLLLNKKNYIKQINSAKSMAIKFSKPVALIVPMKFFSKFQLSKKKQGKNLSLRYEFLKIVLKNTNKKDFTVSSLGNVSRELYVLNDNKKYGHSKTFYSIGAMGHANQIALEASIFRKKNKTIILDGDGSLQMHMGNIITIGKYSKNNLIHILFKNGVHESTGHHDLANENIDYKSIFKACGYKNIYRVRQLNKFNKILRYNKKGLTAIIVEIKPGTLKNLPRPSKKPKQLKSIIKF
jgi:phosphonopyruvate decarboxylase